MTNADPKTTVLVPRPPEPVRIVYLLTLNGRAARQVRRLIKRLYDGTNYFYIHVDSRQDYLYRELKRLEQPFQARSHLKRKDLKLASHT